MFGLFLAAVGIGALAKGIGGILERKAQRDQARKEARHQKKLANYRRDTVLGSMEKELVMGMESDYERRGDIDTQMRSQATASAQNTYIGQLGAENQYMGMLASNERAMGELQTQQGASGTKADVNLQTVINAELQANASAQRNQIDKGLNLSTYQNQLATDAAKTEIDRLGRKYDPNSAVMNLYNYKRSRVTGETAIQTNYLDDVIKDNTYNGQWFMADLLGGLGAATDATASIAGIGL